MVNKDLVARTVAVLGTTPRRILITGGTGFVGSHLAETLSEAGHDVLTTGRNPYLAPPGTRFERADIRDAEHLAALCQGQQVVIHSAVCASPWDSVKKLYDTNVAGTQNVIDGCLKHGVKRLVHVSSTAIHFDFKDKFNIEEDAPPPHDFACGYAETKFTAEKLVCAAREQGLNVFIVRARAAYGPGDNHLLPRLLLAYDKGKLRQIGAGTNITELTYIDNLVYGLVLAVERGRAGGVCTITDGEPIKLWELLQNILKQTGRQKSLAAISYTIADRYAQALELWHRATRRGGEPALTRYTVGLLAKNQTFSPAAAQKELDYKPIVSMADGIRSTIYAQTRHDESHATARVDLSLHSTGFISHRRSLAEHGATRQTVRFHALIGLITHPKHGKLLFDTGYAPRFHDVTSHGSYRLYAMATPVTTGTTHTTKSILNSLGVAPTDIRIILSHFHADHLCGVLDFPGVDLIAKRSAWSEVAGRTGLAAVRRAFLPGLLPADIEDRLCLIDQFHDPGLGPFERCHDLFRDGSVRLFDLSGHATGQLGVLLQTAATERKFLVADSVWTRRTVTDNLPLTLPFRLIADDAAKAKQTRQKLVDFHQQYPDIEIIPTHCPDVAREYNFNDRFVLEPG